MKKEKKLRFLLKKRNFNSLAEARPHIIKAGLKDRATKLAYK